jgi:hypothetical protein
MDKDSSDYGLEVVDENGTDDVYTVSGTTNDHTEVASHKYGFPIDEVSQSNFEESTSHSRRESMCLNAPSEHDISSNLEVMDVTVIESSKCGKDAEALKAMGSFKPFKPQTTAAPFFKPTAAPVPSVPQAAASFSSGLETLQLNNEFTPSTPYVHKFRTEMCKNFELYGKCKYGDEVSIFVYFTTIQICRIPG